MASRKRLRPVAAPVDPFVTPANPGPEQSNQTWDGLLQLSSSLFQADAAYRAADERKKQEARVAKAEEREQRREADKYAPVAFEVLNSLSKQDRDLYKSGDAPEELKLRVAGLLHEAGVPDASNPQLLQALVRFEVARIPQDTGYATMMEDPAFLESIANQTPEEQQAAFNERKQAYIADLVGSGRLTQAQVPLLMGSLRVLDDERNESMARRRDRQFEAKTNALLSDAAGALADAVSMGTDEQKVAAYTNAKSLMDTLSATRRDIARTKFLSVVKDTMIPRINSGEMSEEDALEELSGIQDAGLLDGEQQADLDRVVFSAIDASKRRAQDPTSITRVNAIAQGRLAEAIRQQEVQNGGEPLTEEQLREVVNGQLDDIRQLYAENNMAEEMAASQLLVAKSRARADREAPRSDDRDLVVSLDSMVDDFNPDAIDNINQAYADKKITGATRNRLLEEVERSTDPEQVSSRVSRFLQREIVPAGLEAPDLQRDLEQVFLTTPGSIKEKSQALQKRYSSTIEALLRNQPEALRTDAADYWMSPERRGSTLQILGGAIGTTVGEYYGDNPEEGFRDILQYMFDGLPDAQKAEFRRSSRATQNTLITGYISDLGKGENRQDLNNFLDNKTKKIRRDDAANISRNMSITDRKLAKDIGAAAVSITDAYVAARADLGEQGDWFKSQETHYAEKTLDRFSDVVPGQDILERTPSTYAWWYRRGRYNRQYKSEALLFDALALANQVSDGVQVNKFNEFTGVESANKYLKAHFLNYGVPIKSMAAGKHLNVQLGQDFTFNSSPYFSSLEDLNSQVTQNEEGIWEVSDDVAKAFGVLGLSVEQEAIINFYNAQSKLVPTTPELQELFRRQQTPDFEGWEHMITDGIWRNRSGARFSVEEFQKTVMGAK